MRGLDPVLGGLPLQPIGELGHALVHRHPRPVAEDLAGEGDVGEAVADVADPVLAGHLGLEVLAADHAAEAGGGLAPPDALPAAGGWPPPRGPLAPPPPGAGG